MTVTNKWTVFSTKFVMDIKKYTVKKIINTPNAPAPIGPYNQAVLIGNTLYISGQIPLDPITGNL